MLNFTDITLRRGPRVLVDGLSWTVYAGQRAGITGRNGTGKSSLLEMVRGDLAPDHGELNLPGDVVIAHVRQDTPALECSALDYVLDGDAEWREVSRALESAEASGDGTRIAALHERMHAIDGYTTPARAARLLHGLGFSGTIAVVARFPDQQKELNDLGCIAFNLYAEAGHGFAERVMEELRPA